MTRRYTVQQLANLSGVSVRTLHHYDRIGLLVPAFFGENGYRYYREPELLRLQQILFHREFGITLKEIAALLDQPEATRGPVLAQHRKRLEAEAARCHRLIETIDRTMASLKGKYRMEHEHLYRGFSPEKQTTYEAEIITRYGKEAVQRSSANFKAMSGAQKQAMMVELADIEGAMAACKRQGISSEDPRLSAILDRHRHWVVDMWDRACPPDAYAGLADLYMESPEFRTRYETIEPGLTDYLGSAMKFYAARQS